MTTEDDEFLKQYNSKRAAADSLSEDEFERIMDVFEETATAQTPFASVDNTVAPYDTMVPSLNQLGLAHIMPHAKAIYEHWKSRRLECGNKAIHPTLKFETHQETDDMDPYVCFRRREARQTRKTRARDVQSAEKLKRLRRELEEGRHLIVLAREREVLKREVMKFERSVFEQRQKVKAMKNRLGIKGEDEDLIHQKVSGLQNVTASPPPIKWLTVCSLRSARPRTRPRSRSRPAPSTGCRRGLTLGSRSPISCSWRTSSRRRRTSCVWIWRIRFCTIASGTRIMWTSRRARSRPSRTTGWRT